MTDSGAKPVIAPEEPADSAYGQSYLEWKGWEEANFAKAGSLETAYFDAELKRSGFTATETSRVLEIGFGNGSFLAYARNKSWNTVGTEVNEFLVRMAKARGLTAIHADELDTLESSSFDLIVAFDVLEHIPPSGLLAFVQELVTLLRPGGLLLARFPNADSPFGLLNQNGDITHLTAIGLGKVRYLNRELETNLVFFGGQAVPLHGGSVTRSLRRMLGLALFKVADAFVNRVFFSNDHIAFCSSNVVMVLQVPR